MAPYADVTSTDFTYTGQRALPDTGLMDYRARFYSPSLKRFIQPDTIIPGAANPQSWNRYSYVGNNPIRFNDPTGHMRCDFCDMGGGGDTNPTPPVPENPGSDDPGSNDNENDDDGDTGGEDPIDPSEKYPGGYCWDYNSLVGCTQDGMPLYMGEEPIEIDPTKFDEMTWYLIEAAHNSKKWDLVVNAWRFDTPFYDHSLYGVNKLSGIGCIDGECNARHELNYVAQGVLWARVDVPKPVGYAIIVMWKILPIGHFPGLPTKGTFKMFDKGYDDYQEIYPP